MSDRTLSAVRYEDGSAVIRVEDVYPTPIDDLWAAVTDPDRLARWIAEVDGDLRVGGSFRIRFTSSWEGSGRVDACEAPRRLQVTTTEDETGASTVIEAVLTEEEGGTRLVVEDRGIPSDEAPDHAAGWQVHLEDLGTALAGGTPGDWSARWRELRPRYDASGPAR